MMHADGANNSQAFIDSSCRTHTMSAGGNTFINTNSDAVRFGTGAAEFDGSGDFISLLAHTDWNFYANAFTTNTIDMWLKMTDNKNGSMAVFEQVQDVNNYWIMYHTGAGGGGMRFIAASGGSTVIDTGATVAGEITDTNWHHFAFVKSGSEYGAYLDGTQFTYVVSGSLFSLNAAPLIGADPTAIGARDYVGHIDELRMNTSNTFSAVPVVGLTDTITIPTNAPCN